MGNLPSPPGNWVRLEVSAADVGLVGLMIDGMAFSLVDGAAAWGCAGISNSTTALETNWVSDQWPVPLQQVQSQEDFNWIGIPANSCVNGLARQTKVQPESHQHYFTGATPPLLIETGDQLFAWVFVLPGALPGQLMLQWRDLNGSWDHRAFWGDNLILPAVETNSATNRTMGALPGAGQWIRLVVPAADVGLANITIDGMAFSLWGGGAAWGCVGKSSTIVGALGLRLENAIEWPSADQVLRDAPRFGFESSVFGYRNGKGGFVLRIVGPAGQRCWIESSSDLVDWMLIKADAFPSDGVVQLTNDELLSTGQQYYRIRP